MRSSDASSPLALATVSLALAYFAASASSSRETPALADAPHSGVGHRLPATPEIARRETRLSQVTGPSSSYAPRPISPPDASRILPPLGTCFRLQATTAPWA